jgi:hypothetical protein
MTTLPRYKPEIAIYYGPIQAENRLIPAPEINISVQYSYSNDTIIGYFYVVNITGGITALDLRDIPYDTEYTDQSTYSTGAVTDAIYKLRQILSQNGNILHIVNAVDNSIIMKARGGILRSFNISESPNNWVHFANYTASIEFNTIDFTDKVEDCDNLFLDPDTYAKGTKGIVDIDKYKIKEFNDSWSFTFEDPDMYSRFNETEAQPKTFINIDNSGFRIEYNISATGKHNFVYTDEETGESQLLPAWEQAKNFVQERLYYQVTNLINGVLKNTYSSGCSSTDGLRQIHDPTTSEQGLLSDLGDSGYKIYNETITCNSSESEGSFSATYTATVKSNRFLSGNAFSSASTRHKITKSVNRTRNGASNNISISINGNIEGLIEGGLIRSPQPIRLPAQGAFLISNTISTNKYTQAKNLLNQIFITYNNGIGAAGKRDLVPQFKQLLSITMADLGIPNVNPDDIVNDPPHPTSLNLTHDFNNGTINYTLEYNSSSTLGRKYREISVQTSDASKVIATFNIPNSNSCPLIQDLGTFTAKTITLTIQGVDLSDSGHPNLDFFDLGSYILQQQSCNISQYIPVTLPIVTSDMIKTFQTYNANPIDGSYTITINYICGNGGCRI